MNIRDEIKKINAGLVGSGSFDYCFGLYKIFLEGRFTPELTNIVIVALGYVTGFNISLGFFS
jgi:hypothetical protein